MSSQGGGKCSRILAAPLGVVGIMGGIVMLVDDSLEAAYQARKAKDKETKKDAYQDTLSRKAPLLVEHIETLSQKIAAQTEQETGEATSPGLEALRQVLTPAHAALADVDAFRPSTQETQRDKLLSLLNKNIARYGAQLAASIITRAKSARNGSIDEIRQAISMLEDAYRQIETPATRLARQKWEVEHTLRLVRTQIYLLDDMLNQTESTERPDFIEQRSTLTALVDTAQSSLDTEPTKAQQLAEEAQRVAHVLTESVSVFLLNAWADINSQVNRQVDTLNTLQNMVKDSQVLKVAEETQLNELTQRITAAYNQAEAIRQSSSIRVAQRLRLLATRTESLQEDVFALIGTYQQQTVAETIATTLDKFGLQTIEGEAPTIQVIGDTMRVRAVRRKHTSSGKDDDKLVTFDISQRGDFFYDFSGYTDEECIKEAEQIFEALWSAGIYLLDEYLVNTLLKINPDGISLETLKELRFRPKANKLQMELSNRIQAVLQEMDFEHIEQSSVGGCIELDAFKGNLGYRVVLPPEGTFEVYEGEEQTDISTDSSDLVVAEAHKTVMERETQNLIEEVPSEETDKANKSERKRKTYQEQQKKQSLGY